MKSVSAQNLRHVYKGISGRNSVALDRIDLCVRAGEFAAILGESGSGKSTLLSILAGFLLPTEGQVHLGDEAITEPGRENVLLFQNPCLLPWLDVRRNVSLGAKWKFQKEADPFELEEILISCGLTDIAEHHPSELSAGQAQRCALARALLTKPQVLFLDECFSHLDVIAKGRLEALLLDRWRTAQMTCVMVTHDLEDALRMAGRILVLERPGKVAGEFEVDLPYSRDVEDPKIQQIKKNLMQLFQKLGGNPS